MSSVFSDDFLPVDGNATSAISATGETARLVGACPVNWKVKRLRMATDRPLERLACYSSPTSGAEPDLHPDRLAPSTIYDLEYRGPRCRHGVPVASGTDRFPRGPGSKAGA